ncbi:MAG: prepilin-type N-terminal cleavage/methylation domain-containing protein, partial [Elusimicrobiaceae bacterium]|nr:prepilin-type N-terminal cleavage/methylation domain-containing protein [Elusimicrobiaceae bacterium]
MNIKNTRQGFTLIEVLVVVLIIGILAAVALPQYQKAVLKSRYSALMPIAKSLADGNEAYYMTNNSYATSPADLDVAGKVEYSDGTKVFMNNDANTSYVRVDNERVPNARYLVYQKHSANFPGTTQCEAGDDKMKAICQSFGGTELSGNSSGEEGWTAFLLTGSVGANDSFAQAGSSGAPEPQLPNLEDYSNIFDKGTGTMCTEGGVSFRDDVGEWHYESTTATTCANSLYKGESYCGSGGTPGFCANSTFSGQGSNCSAGDVDVCANSIFTGERSWCSVNSSEGCRGSTFYGGSACLNTDAAYYSNGCADTIYAPNAQGILGCCAG